MLPENFACCYRALEIARSLISNLLFLFCKQKWVSTKAFLWNYGLPQLLWEFVNRIVLDHGPCKIFLRRMFLPSFGGILNFVRLEAGWGFDKFWGKTSQSECINLCRDFCRFFRNRNKSAAVLSENWNHPNTYSIDYWYNTRDLSCRKAYSFKVWCKESGTRRQEKYLWDLDFHRCYVMLDKRLSSKRTKHNFNNWGALFVRKKSFNSRTILADNFRSCSWQTSTTCPWVTNKTWAATISVWCCNLWCWHWCGRWIHFQSSLLPQISGRQRGADDHAQCCGRAHLLTRLHRPGHQRSRRWCYFHQW